MNFVIDAINEEWEKRLDKIRTEIKNITPKAHIQTGKLSIDTELMIPLDRVLKVLDKYIAESEPQLSSELEKNSKKLEKDFGELNCIDKAELLKAMDTWDKFGNDPNKGLIPLRTPALQDRYVPYVKYDDMVNCVEGMPLVTPEQEPRWIPMVRREPTDEEKAEYLVQNGEELCYMLENEMPLNGQEVLVSIGEFVEEDVFDEDFYNFENNDIENVDAWMPKPKHYEPQESEGIC